MLTIYTVKLYIRNNCGLRVKEREEKPLEKD